MVKSWTDQHVSRFEKLASWLDDMEARAAKADDTSSITGCQSGISNCAVLSGLVAEHRDNIEALLNLGKKLTEAKHGGWAPEQKDLDAVSHRQSEVVSRRDKLDASLKAKSAALEQALEANLTADEKRLEWAIAVKGAIEFLTDLQQSIADTPATSFGFDLEEVKKVDTKALDKADHAAVEERKKELAALSQWSDDAKQGKNPYTKLSLADFDSAAAGVADKLKTRDALYEATIAKLSQEDALCAKFAQEANKLAAEITASKDEISNSSASVEEQLKKIEEALQEASKTPSKAAPVVELWKPVEAAGISDNKHTRLTGPAIAGMWDQFGVFVRAKKQVLEDLDRLKKLRGLSTEQWAAIDAQFKQFDKAGKGALDAQGFSNALFALGESRKKPEMEALMKQLANDQGEVDYPTYVDYLVKVIGGQNTQDKIEEALQLINNGPEARIELMAEVFTPEQLKYIQQSAPKDAAGNVDLKAWVAAMFAK